MMSEPRTSFVQILRDIDDAGLDVYEFRLWVHIWRVGASWETQRTLAKKCGMSLGKVSAAMKSLIQRNMLVYTEHRGRMSLTAVLCSPDEQCSPHEQLQQNEDETDVVNVHDMNGVFTTRTECSPHEQDVHHMNAILSIPTEEDNFNGEGDRANGRPVSPPPIVKHQPADRTPGGNGYRPPSEPAPQDRPPSPEREAVGEMANAITEVTGISARLNWSDPKGNGVGDLAASLVAAGYTPDQLRRHYSRQRAAGAWNWYDQDWRGKKGETPSLKGIRETIAGATQVQTATKKLSQIDRALAMFNTKPATP